MAAAYGRSLQDLGELSSLEERLKDKARRGEFLELGDIVPSEIAPEITIRALVIRFFVLGGDTENPVHERGVRLKGARVSGNLDLVACSGCRPVYLEKCFVDGKIILDGATTQTINLQGSYVTKLTAESAQIKGDLLLRDGFRSMNAVEISTAKIEGILKLGKASFAGRTTASIRRRWCSTAASLRGTWIFMKQSAPARSV
jgi:hypothetical protein